MRNYMTVAYVVSVFCGIALTTHPACAQVPDAGKSLRVEPISDSPAFAKRALIIGVGHYENADQLPACDDDAHAVADLLKSQYNFPPQSIVLMTDEPAQPEASVPTYLRLKHEIKSFLDSLDKNSEVVIFFSGHGTSLDNQDWLVPKDGDPADVEGSCVSYTNIKNQLDTIQPHRALLLVDACRDLVKAKGIGSSGFGASGAPDAPEVAELLSCRRTEVSQIGVFDGRQQSVFTHFLLQGLQGDPLALADDKNQVTFDSLERFVKNEVSQYVLQQFHSAQNPDGRTSLGEMVLARIDKSHPVAAPAPLPAPPPAVDNDWTAQLAAEHVSATDAAALDRTGLKYYGLNDNVTAEKFFSCALHLTPNDTEVLMNEAATLVNLDRTDEARTTAQRALQLGYRTANWVYGYLGINPG